MVSTISKEEADRLMHLKGEIRGIALKDDFKYIFQREGQKGLDKLENTLKSLGYPIKYNEIKAMTFYPIGLDNLLLTILNRIFNYTDKDFQEMGKFHSKSTLLMKIFMNYFISIDRLVKESPKMWKTYYSEGELEVIEFNKKERYIILKIKNFANTKFQCQSQIGYFTNAVHMITKNKVSCEETKCVHKGDKYHEFLLKW
jgi:hypothetical protein